MTNKAKPTLVRCYSYMKNLKNTVISVLTLIFVTCFSTISFAPNGDMPVDDVTLKLSDGRVLHLSRISQHAHIFTIKKSGKLICKRKYEEEYDRVWDWAFFVPVKKGHYEADVNGDGMPEIAIATWDGGNNIAERYVSFLL